MLLILQARIINVSNITTVAILTASPRVHTGKIGTNIQKF